MTDPNLKLTGAFQMDYDATGRYHSYYFEIQWKGTHLRNKRKGPFRYWRTIDLRQVRGWEVFTDQNILKLEVRSTSKRKVSNVFIQFAVGDYYTWIYWLLVAIAKHGKCEFSKANLRFLDEGRGSGSLQRGEILSLRDKFKYKSKFKTFDQAHKRDPSEFGGPIRSNGAYSGSTGASYGGLRRIGESGEAKIFASDVDIRTLVFGTIGFAPDYLPNWDPGSMPVALRTPLDDSASGLKAFIKETRKHAALGEHNNIIKLLDVAVGTKGGYVIGDERYDVIVVMERGIADLENLIKKKIRRLTSRQKLEIALGILHGLNHMHKRNIYHLDIKPGNVVLTEDLTPKIIDFGMAFRIIQGKPVKMSDIDAYKQKGTAGYMTPETFDDFPLGHAELALRLGKRDSYAAGMTFLDALIGGYRENHTFGVGQKGVFGISPRFEQQKIDFYNRKVPTIRDRTLLDLGRLALLMIDANFTNRLTIHQAKQKCKRKYKSLMDRIEAQERRTRGSEATRRELDRRLTAAARQTRDSRPGPSRVKIFKCRYCGFEAKNMTPIRCRCGRNQHMADGPTFTAIYR